MPLFRKHRGSLNESLKTTVIVKTLDELKQVIWDDWKIWVDVEQSTSSMKEFDVRIIPYPGDCDYRCGWYTQLITANILTKESFLPIGYLSEPIG